MTRLKFSNPYGEVFWFVRLGVQWPNRPERRLIESTTPKRGDARVFQTEEEARTTLVVAGEPLGWEVVSSPD